LVVKVIFFAIYSLSTSCTPNLKLLALTVAETNRGLHFLDAPLARTLANFGRSSCFSASYSPSPSCIPNLKSLSSTAAKVIRGCQNFWLLPKPTPPPSCPESLKVVFGMLLVEPKYIYTPILVSEN